MPWLWNLAMPPGLSLDVGETRFGSSCGLAQLSLLPSVSVDSYNLELRDEDGAFLGDPGESPGLLHKVSGSHHLCELYQSSTSFLAWSLA